MDSPLFIGVLHDKQEGKKDQFKSGPDAETEVKSVVP